MIKQIYVLGTTDRNRHKYSPAFPTYKWRLCNLRWPQWLSSPVECSGRNVLALLKLGHKKPCGFCLGYRECWPLGHFLLEPRYHTASCSSHTGRPCILPPSITLALLSGESQHQLPAMWVHHHGHPTSLSPQMILPLPSKRLEPRKSQARTFQLNSVNPQTHER